MEFSRSFSHRGRQGDLWVWKLGVKEVESGQSTTVGLQEGLSGWGRSASSRWGTWGRMLPEEQG